MTGNSTLFLIIDIPLGLKENIAGNLSWANIFLETRS